MADYLGKKIKFNIEDNDLQKIRFNKVYGESQQATRSGKNLFDKDNANIINTYIAGSGNGVLPSDGGAENKCVYIPCKQNTTYTIQKMIGKRFGVAYTYETPAQGVMAYNKTVDNNVASITITTDSSAKYLVVYLRNGNASGEITLQQALDSLQIEKGSTATDYEPYGVMPSPDYRSKIENLEGMNILDISKYVDTSLWERTNNYFMFTPILNEDIPKFKDVLSGRMELKGTAQNLVFALTSEKVSPTTELRILDNGTLQDTSYDFKNADNIYLAIGNRNMISSDKSEIGLIFNNYNIMIKEGTVATPYVPYNSLEFKDEGKNKFNVQDTNNVTEGITVDNEGWITVTGDNTDGTATKYFNYFTNNLALKTVTNYNVIAEVKSVNGTGIVHFASNGSTSKQFETRFYRDFTNLANNKVYKLICKTADEFVGNNGLRTFVEFSAGQSGSITFRLSVLEDTTITAENFEYEEYKSQVATFPLAEGQKLYKGSYLADDGIHHKRKQVVFDGSREYIRYTSLDTANYNCFYTNQSDIYVDSTGTQITLMGNYFKGNNFNNRAVDIANMWVNKFASQIYFKVPNTITTVEELTTLFAEQYANGTPVIVEYELAEEEIVPYTETQQEAREKLRHFKGLNGENNITAQGTMTSTLDLTLYNVAEEDFDIYISKKGYFGALKYDINNLIDFMESNIPSIAEATESSVKIAGRDGDIPLNTVYEPLSFEIVCYTEDNLTPEEKIIEEQKITSLLNSIKNQTKTFFMEREKKFYKVKYSGNLSVVRYPKHLKFTIPLKSSESYAMNFEESEIIGNGTKVSNTIKDTGAIFTIKGPATKPIISLNNYQMKYNENILEGNSLIINSEDSTITHITSAGVKTNAMRAYNHEFPKIKNGENQLAVSSGIDDEKQVNVKWYDLKI